MKESSRPVPLLSLWYKPRRTLQGLIASGGGRFEAIIVAGLFGFVQAWRLYIDSEATRPGVLITGAIVGIVGIYLCGWLIRNFGRWFGSSAKQVDVRTALGWGALPWTVLFGALSMMVARAGDASELAGIYPLFFGGFLYGYVILLLSLSAALRLSVLKTFVCLVFTSLVSIFPLTLIAQLVFGDSSPSL